MRRRGSPIQNPKSKIASTQRPDPPGSTITVSLTRQPTTEPGDRTTHPLPNSPTPQLPTQNPKSKIQNPKSTMTTAHLSSPTATPPPPAPLPALEPLEMLYVTNGSLLTAEGWWQSHRYYQHRQNLHYQSLHQPGIVSGLGVRVVAAPDSVPSELRDRRWIEIQPGIAIDLVGNPLVVEEPMTFRITSEVIQQGSESTTPHPSSSTSNGALMVYVVLAYVDPTAKQWQTQPTAVVKEEFRINERTTPPEAHEVELCRIHLTSNIEPLENAADVFNPAPQNPRSPLSPPGTTQSIPLRTSGRIFCIPNLPPLPTASVTLRTTLPTLRIAPPTLECPPPFHSRVIPSPSSHSYDSINRLRKGRRQKAEGRRWNTPTPQRLNTPTKIQNRSTERSRRRPKSKIQNPKSPDPFGHGL